MLFEDKNGNEFSHYKHPMTSLLGVVRHRNTIKEMFLLILLSYLSVNGVVVSGTQCIDSTQKKIG